MTDAPKRSLDQIVSEAQTLPPEDQLRYIRDACASDHDLYASALYQLHSRQAWPDLEDAIPDNAPSARVSGQLIGPYRIVRSLGAGGMGEVFLAERADDQFNQQVAIKLVKPGLLSRHVQSRLRQERQILASLEHPNIARLYDGGATQDGTPYIVMEYVDGEPIDTFCNRRRLSVEQRLQLFLQVCAAVHRAHQNLVVHRDLKPSNILVTAEGKPKLLDFGIAKLLDDRQLTHTMAVTQADIRVMTPDHASPEQIRGDVVTTASDIYVLGVLLYELLCGYRPFILRGNRLAELERAICEDTPLAMSEAVAAARDNDASGIAEIAAERGVSEAKLGRQLQGDLDRIAMMAMRKEADRRYASVEQLAADIENHLHGMPVVARPDTWGYRASKFVRRHRVAVALSGAFFALLIGFSVITYVQARRIEVERDLALEQRQRAEAERAHAQAVAEFLVDAFRLADPSQSKGKNITAREILDSGALRIQRELQNQPALQATLLDTIGSVYLGLGEFDEAQPLIERGLSVRRKLDATSLDVARSLYNLNRLHEKRGDLAQAEALARESLEIYRKQTGETSLETASSLCRLGAIQFEKDELSAAEALFNRCLELRTAKLGPDHEEITVPLDSLSRIAQARGDLSTAERLLRRSLDIERRTRGQDHPLYIQHTARLALVTYDQGNVQEAESLYRQAIAAYQRVFGAEHPETLDAMSSFGMFLLETDRFEEAGTVLTNVLNINRRLRPHHAYIGNDLELLGRLAFRQGNFAKAEQLFNESLQIYRNTLPACHGLIAASSTMLGRTQLARNAPAAAEKTLTQAVQCWQIEYSSTTPGYAVARAALARAWALQGKYAQAESALLESYPIIARATAKPYKEAAVSVRGWIEDLYRSTGRAQASQEFFRKLEQIR